MENTLKELIKDASAIDEMQLAEISGKLWKSVAEYISGNLKESI